MHETNMNGQSCGNCGSGSCMSCGPMGCKCNHHKVIPAAIVLIGLSFLLTNLGVVSANFTQTLWPILVIVIGLMKMTKGMCKCDMKK